MQRNESDHSPSWYVLRTRAAGEEAVARTLADDSEIAEVYVPRFAQDIDCRYRAGELLFPGYVFFRSAGRDALFNRIGRMEGVLHLLGQRGHGPSAVAEEEMETVRRLASAPEVILVHALPRKGRRARITAGPLMDVEGVIVSRSAHRIRLRSLVNVLGRVVEISVAPDHIETLDFWAEDGKGKPRHRAGRRARRSRVA